MIDVLEIEERLKPHPMGPATQADFRWRRGGQADPSIVIEDPTVSLYCLDHRHRLALFVQVPSEVDVTAGPFLFLSQYEHAVRLLSVPYDVLYRVAAQVDIGVPLLCIHSTGRAGSTLLSNAFAEMGSVTSLSEPDVYTQATALRLAGGDEEEIGLLLASATRVLFNPSFTRGSNLYVLKFRSFCIEVVDLLTQGFPTVRNLFLYRDLAPYMLSAVRAFGLDDAPTGENEFFIRWLVSLIPFLAQELRTRHTVDSIEPSVLSWLSSIDAYVRMRRAGIAMPLVRYDDLVADPRCSLTRILGFLDLPNASVEQGMRAFERDSQAGTPLGREEKAGRSGAIDRRRWEIVRDLVRRYPVQCEDLPEVAFAVP